MSAEPLLVPEQIRERALIVVRNLLGICGSAEEIVQALADSGLLRQDVRPALEPVQGDVR